MEKTPTPVAREPQNHIENSDCIFSSEGRFSAFVCLLGDAADAACPLLEAPTESEHGAVRRLMLARRAPSLVSRVSAGAQLQSRRCWLSASAAASDDPAVVCYLDIKSPHAYLILKPALQVQEDYAVRVEFKPYKLDFVEMGISKTRPEDGHPERVSPSVQADRRARMFYAVARDYAALQGIQIRGPYKLLQSRLANLALGYARGESDHNHMKVDVEYLRTVFDAGWPNGWREYDMESADVLKATLSELGADVSGFDEYVHPAVRLTVCLISCTVVFTTCLSVAVGTLSQVARAIKCWRRWPLPPRPAGRSACRTSSGRSRTRRAAVTRPRVCLAGNT